VRTCPAGGGHEWTEYWLTKFQYIFFAAKFETPVSNYDYGAFRYSDRSEQAKPLKNKTIAHGA
jgi:hypothetical protein